MVRAPNTWPGFSEEESGFFSFVFVFFFMILFCEGDRVSFLHLNARELGAEKKMHLCATPKKLLVSQCRLLLYHTE